MAYQTEASVHKEQSALVFSNRWQRDKTQDLSGRRRRTPIQSRQEQGVRLRFWRGIVSAVCLFFLLREWIMPLTEISRVTDLYFTTPLLIALGSYIALDAVRCPWYCSWPLKLGISLALIVHYYDPGSWLDAAGWQRYFTVFLADMEWIRYGLWAEISPETRTVSLLLGWAILSYALYQLFIHRVGAGWLTCMTIGYLLLLQIFLELNTAYAIVRTAGAGLVLLATLRQIQYSVVEKLILSGHEESSGHAKDGFHGMSLHSKHRCGRIAAYWTQSVISLLVVSLIIVGSWFASSVMDGAWRTVDWRELELVNTWKKNFYDHSQAVQAITAYDTEDSRLGASLNPDPSVAFMAVTERFAKWRGETKAVYTGSGWVYHESNIQEFGSLDRHGEDVSSESREMTDESVPYASIPYGAESRTFSQEVLVQEARLGKWLFASGEIVDIQGLIGEDGKWIDSSAVQFDAAHQKYLVDDHADLSYYKIIVALQEQSNLSSEERELYLQLPASLPNRVSALAHQVTEDMESDIEKARAIEAYLRNSYAYTLSDVRMPRSNQDFVDHFLFVDKQGYCDHFSTAMVVMLRAAGIPARWVKGFAPGEAEAAEQLDEGPQRMTVTVRNSDAHSWAEAYIEGEGWIEFEPTPGFADEGNAGEASVAAAHADIDDGSGGTAGEGEAGQQTMWTKLRTWFAEARERMGIISQDVSSNIWGVYQYLQQHLWMLIVLTVALCLPMIFWIGRWLIGWRKAVSEFRTKSQALAGISESRHLNKSEREELQRIWRKVFKRFGTMDPGLTIREYIASLRFHSETQERAVYELGQLYEHCVYGQAQADRRSLKSRAEQLWRMIKD